MGEDAGAETFRAIGDEIVERAGNERGRPIGHRMREAEGERNDGEREPGESAKGDSLEAFRNEITQQESAPKNFFGFSRPFASTPL